MGGWECAGVLGLNVVRARTGEQPKGGHTWYEQGFRDCPATSESQHGCLLAGYLKAIACLLCAPYLRLGREDRTPLRV